MEFKDKDTLVNNAIESIAAKIDDIDFSDGEPLRTFIESIMQEVSLQYWQLEQVYDNSFIDSAYGDDLSELVKIMGVTREEALNSTGKVKFYRDTAADHDYLIPAGTLIETLPDSEGVTIQFETVENVVLLSGTTYIYANVKSVNPGFNTNVVANKIITINNPPMGIESAINEEAVIGGEDEETDDDLRARTKIALDASGLGTINALSNKILGIPGIKSVKALDMNRGIGTVDILVLGDSLPMPSTNKTEIENLAQTIKAGGIDVKIIEPSISVQNVSITLTLAPNALLADVNQLVINAVNNYINSLGIGDSFIKNQLSKEVLNCSENITDIVINNPTTNITVGSTSIVALGTLTIN